MVVVWWILGQFVPGTFNILTLDLTSRAWWTGSPESTYPHHVCDILLDSNLLLLLLLL